MEREIKFRAWKKSESRMIEWPELSRDPKLLHLAITRIMFESLMQFTGLKDKNGKEIYEGDIVKYHDNTSNAYILDEENAEKTVGQINWIEHRCQFAPQEIKENHRGGHYISHWDFTVDLEVIGNIHENPELLQAAKEMEKEK